MRLRVRVCVCMCVWLDLSHSKLTWWEQTNMSAYLCDSH